MAKIQKRLNDYLYYLFDADGTLIDTTELIYQSYKATVERFAGRLIGREEVIREIGKPLQSNLEAFLGKQEEAQLAEIVHAHSAIQMALAPDYIKLFPGVKGVLQRLKARGKILAVVTSRRRTSLTAYFQTLGIYDCFVLFITPEATRRHKPHPEPLLAAVAELGAAPGDCVFIGDTRYDLESAQAAGIASCFVSWSDTPPAALPLVPDYILAAMEELL